MYTASITCRGKKYVYGVKQYNEFIKESGGSTDPEVLLHENDGKGKTMKRRIIATVFAIIMAFPMSVFSTEIEDLLILEDAEENYMGEDFCDEFSEDDAVSEPASDAFFDQVLDDELFLDDGSYDYEDHNSTEDIVIDLNDEESVYEDVLFADMEQEEETSAFEIEGGKTYQTFSGEQQIYSQDNAEQTPEELVEGYLQKITDTASGRIKLKAKKGAANRLTDVNAAVYQSLYNSICQVAAGTRTVTQFEIPLEEMGLTQYAWSAADLGVEAIIVDGNLAYEAQEAFLNKASVDLQLVISALLADCPYELYWFDKTGETLMSGPEYSLYCSADGEYMLEYISGITVSMPVISEYAASLYEVDPSVGESIQTCVNRALSIVETYASSSDYDKLYGYLKEICNRVSYNYDALSSAYYGNPWQLIWVFDENAATNVVCEGYAKAFQYLCDLTEFDNDIVCRTVTGVMSGGTGAGEHMWNIVQMEDGYNYLVDATNCDVGTIGADDKLFLAGTDKGDVETGYSFDCNSAQVAFTYSQETLQLYDEIQLCLNDKDYLAQLSEPCEVEITPANFPDPQLRDYISGQYDVDNDGILSSQELSNVTLVACQGPDGYDLTSVKGIEYFYNLQVLVLNGNHISELDVSHNTELIQLWCWGNLLTELDVSHNKKLKLLSCEQNNLSSLDVTHNTELEYLWFNINNINEIDISHNPNLLELTCDTNNLSSVDVSNNPLLQVVNIGINPISSFDTTALPELKSLAVTRSNITSLDLSNNSKLEYLECGDMTLDSLDLSHCPMLMILLVDRAGLNEIDMTHNTRLTTVHCGGNTISKLDLSGLLELNELYCDSNNLTELDITNNIELVNLQCSHNMIEWLNTDNNTNLAYLACDNNSIHTLDLSSNTHLGTLITCFNCLENIDLSNNIELEYLDCGRNQLENLDITKNVKLKHIGCVENCLRSLDVQNNPELERLECDHNEIEKLDVKKNEKLVVLLCKFCAITDLQFGNNTELSWLEAYNNKISSIDASQCGKLYNLLKSSELLIDPSGCAYAASDDWSERIFLDPCTDIFLNTEHTDYIAGSHAYGDWKTVKEATCTEAGTKEKVCRVCGKNITEVIPAYGHIWDEEYTIDKEATFTEEGSKSIHCVVCGEINEATITVIPIEETDKPEQSGFQTMHRMYNPYTEEHLYTGSEAERDTLVRAGWQYDGVAWNAPVDSNIKVYRLYNPYGDFHFYSSSEEEIANLESYGWIREGVAWCSDEAQGTPIYRLFNPYVQTNYHMFTTGADERDLLVSVGWRFEGVAFYGVK